MSEIFFVIKSLIVTVLVIMLLQVKVGDDTIENQAHSWVVNSPVGERVSEVAQGLWKLSHEGYRKIAAALNSSFEKEGNPGQRTLMTIRRSAKVLKEKGEDAVDSVEESIGD